MKISAKENSTESGSGLFKGFMMQARPSENGTAFGTFRLIPDDSKSMLFECPASTSDVSTDKYSKYVKLLLIYTLTTALQSSVSHKNPDPVLSVSVNWHATQEQLQNITEFKY